MNLNRTSALSARTHLLASVALAAVTQSSHAMAEESTPKRSTAHHDGAGTHTHSLTSKGFGSGNKAAAKNGECGLVKKTSGKVDTGAHGSAKNGSGLTTSHHYTQRGAGSTSVRTTNHRNS